MSHHTTLFSQLLSQIPGHVFDSSGLSVLLIKRVDLSFYLLVTYHALMKYWLIAFIFIGISFIGLSRWVIPSFVFHPTKDIIATPAAVGLHFENVRVHTPDGETIAGWYIPAKVSRPEESYTMLFFHGNAGNISHRLKSLTFFHKLGLSIFIIDYRGFGQSTGKPSVSGTVLDARAAWHWLTENKGVPSSRIILFGRSLGGGVAAALSTQVEPKALILESTFTSLHDMGETIVPWLPRILFSEDYTTLRNLENLRMPLLVAHSQEDEMINFRMGRALFDSYTGPKHFLQIYGSHNDGWHTSIAVYEKEVKKFLRAVFSEGF